MKETKIIQIANVYSPTSEHSEVLGLDDHGNLWKLNFYSNLNEDLNDVRTRNNIIKHEWSHYLANDKPRNGDPYLPLEDRKNKNVSDKIIDLLALAERDPDSFLLLPWPAKKKK